MSRELICDFQSKFSLSQSAFNQGLSYTGYKRFTAVFPDNWTPRPIAIVLVTPSTLDGLYGPGQRNGAGFPRRCGKRSVTVDCFRLNYVVQA